MLRIHISCYGAVVGRLPELWANPGLDDVAVGSDGSA